LDPEIVPISTSFRSRTGAAGAAFDAGCVGANRDAAEEAEDDLEGMESYGFETVPTEIDICNYPSRAKNGMIVTKVSALT
jgi:hypothetical protein